ncbi:NeuD/PglB/VioB family sugar acetyltransferase [Nereida ignava]|uniref:NeuD/PglB/VioB family sugar acetyltransferase n=1 Tax=Nereida ignava TaxID=282199 RepID=UPI002FE354F7
MTQKTLVIAGAGGLGREVFQWAQDQIAANQADFSVVKFIEDSDGLSRYPEVSSGLLSTIKSYSPDPDHLIVIAVGNTVKRRLISNDLESKGAQFGSVIHPSAIIARNSKVQRGLIMCPNSIISTHTKIGEHTHINFGASVGHDCLIGDFVTISSHVDIMGFCVVKDDVFLGSGSRILPKCSVAKGSKIGAGAQVQRSLKTKSTLYQSSTKKL